MAISTLSEFTSGMVQGFAGKLCIISFVNGVK